MQMSFGVAFLIVAASVLFHFSFGTAVVLLGGYGAFASLDEWLAKRARGKVIEDELVGWQHDPDEPECETKGNLTRVRLSISEQIIVTRVLETLKRL